MKFKAKLNPQQTNLLYNLIHPISRLHPSSASTSTLASPSTILYLDDDKLVLSTRGGSYFTTSNSILHSSSHTINSTYTQSNNDAEGIFCFAELITKNGIFREHVIQSLENDNAILMEINILQLKTALKGVLDAQVKYTRQKYGTSANGAVGMGVIGPELTIKLAKRNGEMPHLCLDVKENKQSSQEIASLSVPNHGHNNQNHLQGMGSSNSTMVGVHHAIPVRMMRVEELQYHVPPQLGMPDVQLELPRDRPLKNVVDRLRMMHSHVYIKGSMNGLLDLSIQGDGTKITTSFNNLIPIHEDCKRRDDESNNNNPDNPSQQQHQQIQQCTVKLDSKKLYASLHWQATLNMVRDVSSAVLCMWENEMLVLDVTLNPEIGRFMYYVPVHFISDDWA